MYWTRHRTLAPTLDIDTDIEHRHLCGAGRLGGLVETVGHVSEPPKVSMLKLVYMKNMVSECACGVYSTFESNTSKYPLETLRPKCARVSRVSCMHGT